MVIRCRPTNLAAENLPSANCLIQNGGILSCLRNSQSSYTVAVIVLIFPTLWTPRTTSKKKTHLPRIIAAAWERLKAGDSALNVVEFAVNALEMAPCFNAGIGGALDTNGQVCLDASIMRGDTLEAGADTKLREIPKAISVARKVMETTGQVLLADTGANAFAAQFPEFERYTNEDLVTPLQAWRLKHSNTSVFRDPPNKGTVGAVARDANDIIAAGTSTGGLRGNKFGRVGDSPIIGAGCYADNTLGGASTTGYGEQMIRKNTCKSALDRMQYLNLSADAAAQAAIDDLGQLELGLGWIILINPDGDIGWAGNELWCPRARMSSDMVAPEIAMQL